jgi:hypothetical protein
MSFIFTVFFEDPFWVGVFSLNGPNTAKYCRVVFGKEPSDIELYEYFLKNYYFLKFSESVSIEAQETAIKNPKRRQREISKELHSRMRTRKSYEAVKLALQQSQKKQKQAAKKADKEARDNHIFDLKQQKYKEKHKGH